MMYNYRITTVIFYYYDNLLLWQFFSHVDFTRNTQMHSRIYKTGIFSRCYIMSACDRYLLYLLLRVYSI